MRQILKTLEEKMDQDEAKPAERSDVDAIMRAINEWAKQHLDPDILVYPVQGSLYLSLRGTGKSSQQRLLAAKKQLESHILQQYKHRRWTHAKSRGDKMWYYYYGNNPEGVKVGMEITLTPEEKFAVLSGGWKDIQGDAIHRG